ncbi:hypothetical protein BAE44_0008621 [Dichanthelium oligosanthes]|uniref:DUF1618 domain-containing protein n=1 Tax=Dichanthelium oligosanthes TaxID=888268 RepID=A0A1E5VYZ9_9POAL|nr:hypothetical protein BAE44_0008621 [Dichanthelium oligosanthes]
MTPGCVNGVIKFVAMVGYYKNYDTKDLTLRSWTLSRDLKEWEAARPLRVEDIWASESFHERGLPQLVPSFPVVSLDEAEVVYLVLNEVDRVATVDMYGDACVEVVPKARPLLGIGGTSGDIEGSTAGADEEAAAIGDSEMPMEAIMQAMKPNPGVLDSPEISRLSMVRQMKGGVDHGLISSTDKALVVLYAGFYVPGFYTDPSNGCYLVYDASSDSLSAIPQLPDCYSITALGQGAAILSRGEGEYVLAELVATTTSKFPDAALYLCGCAPTWPKANGSGRRCASLCNLLESAEPAFTFVPLPEG